MDTSDLMMMIMKCVIDISSKISEPRHIPHHIVKKVKKVTKRINYILNTRPSEYTHQTFTHASGIFHRMCSTHSLYYQLFHGLMYGFRCVERQRWSYVWACIIHLSASSTLDVATNSLLIKVGQGGLLSHASHNKDTRRGQP